MRAAYYEKNGPVREVLRLGEVETPQPGPDEVRVKLSTSGVNPSDVKAREGRAYGGGADADPACSSTLNAQPAFDVKSMR